MRVKGGGDERRRGEGGAGGREKVRRTPLRDKTPDMLKAMTKPLTTLLVEVRGEGGGR